MKSRFNLDKAAEAEVFGALAVSEDHNHRGAQATGPQITTAQSRALSDLVRSLVHIAREAGADQKQVTVGSISFELRENGSEEILSIRTGADS